jgi:uncharacterized phage protein (TIGR02218 family)
MKAAGANMAALLSGGCITLNCCWRYQRPFDSAVLGFTDHDRAIAYDGVAYTPLAAGNLSPLNQSNRLNPDTQDAELPFAAGAFTASELRAGIWLGARYWVFLINPYATADGIIKLTSGRLGETEIRDHLARIEHRSLTQQLATPILRLMTPRCNADLGDARCTVSMAAFTHTGEVAAGGVSTNRIFKVTGFTPGAAVGYFAYGRLAWTSGLNSGLTMAIDYDSLDSGNRWVVLAEPMPYTVAAGDAFTAYQGCNRLKATCRDRFNNVLNFRGFDLLPGYHRVGVIHNNRRWVTNS